MILPKNAVLLSKYLCRQIIVPGDTVIDATMGNGNDTLFLSELVGNTGQVFAFDIQKEALLETHKKLKSTSFSSICKLILDNHSKMENYIEAASVKLILFNLGYLPKGNHKITTTAAYTIEAVNSAINLLVKNGVIILVIYPGHSEGLKEKLALEVYVKKLNQKHFNVLSYNFSNQINNPPLLIAIEKLS